MDRSGELRDLVLRSYRDSSLWAEMYSLLDEVPIVGTAPDEWWIGGAEARAITRTQMDEGWASIRWVPGELHAWTEGSVGWTVDNPTAVLADGSEDPGADHLCVPS